MVWVGRKTNAGYPTIEACLVLVETSLTDNVTHTRGFPPVLECADTIGAKDSPPATEVMGGLETNLGFKTVGLEV